MTKLSQEEMQNVKGGSLSTILNGVFKSVDNLVDGIFGSVTDNREISGFNHLSEKITNNSLNYGKVELKIGDESLKIDNSAYFDSLTPNIDFVSIL